MDAASSPIFFILVVSTTVVQSQITKGPANALRKVGDKVTLECVTSRNNCSNVEWKKMEGAQSTKNVYRDGIGMFNGFRERYNVNSTGGCNLTISQLKISDSGRFSCVLTMDASEDTRSSILVVINVTEEACRSNVTSNALNQNDSYSFWTSINVPPKSLEPLSVILFFQKEDDNETETYNSQSQTFKTTLAGIAKNQNITRVCRVSLRPNKANGFDSSIDTLYVCTTQQLIVSYPVENIAVSPSSGPYYKGTTIRCTAEGYPYPSFKWTHLKSAEVVVYSDPLVIDGEAGDEYTCTATNTVKGKATSLNITIDVVSLPGCGTGCIIGIVFGGAAFIVAIVVISVFVSKRDK